MCRFCKYEESVSNCTSDRREIVINALKGYQREDPLSRLEAAKTALSDLKVN